MPPDSPPASPHQPFATPQLCYTFAARPAMAWVESGARLWVICPDSDNRLPDGSPVPASQFEPPMAGASAVFAGNPAAGPFGVRSARQGDSIAVTFDRIHPTSVIGRTLLAPNHGLLPGDVLSQGAEPARRMFEWSITADARTATLRNPFGPAGMTVPLAPFVGCAGVAPAHAQAISTLFAGDHGGNMDLPLIGEGSTLLLPVFAPGGLFSLGDIHAAQGYGECMGGGIETAGAIDFSITLRPGDALPFPRILTAGRAYAVASHGDLRQALQLALGRLIDWIERSCKLDRRDAYALLTHTNDFVIGNVITAPYTVAAGVAIDHIPSGAALQSVV